MDLDKFIVLIQKEHLSR